MEGTLFALNMGLSNFGVILGTYMGNGLLLALGGVKGPEFHNLDALVIIRSFARLLPILLIPFLVPDGAPSDEVKSNTTTTSSGGLAFKDSIATTDLDETPDPVLSVSVLRRWSSSSSRGETMVREGGSSSNMEMAPMEVEL